MGIFTGLSNLADLPGSMFRDVVGLDNPFDQLLDPFGEEGRQTTEELTGVGGIPGWLLEVGMDPLTYIGGAGLIKALPKLMKARRAAKGAKAIKRTRALRQARGRAGGRQSHIHRKKRKVAEAVGLSPENAHLVTEELAQGVGLTLKGPKGPGILSRAKGGIAARGRGLKGRAKHGWRQYRRLPRSTQVIVAGKMSPGWAEEDEAPMDRGELTIDRILEQYPELAGFFEEEAMGISEPLNLSSPLERLQMNNPGPEYYSPSPSAFQMPRMSTGDGYYPQMSAPMDLGY